MHCPLTAPVVPAWLLVTVVACLWAEPALWADEVALDDSDAASTTSILPPKLKLFCLTWVLYLLKVEVSHVHTWAAARLVCLVSGIV